MDFLFIPVINNIKVNEEKKEEQIIEPVELIEEEKQPQQMVITNRNTKYVRKFIEKNKDVINNKIECPICYSTYTYFNKSKHLKTKRHLKMLEKNI